MDTDNPWTKSEAFAWNEGRRIVDLFELSKQLLCKRCEALLDLRRIEREDRFGFASVLHVPCVCGVTNELHTSRKQEPSSPSNPMYEVNIKASINLLLYGTGASNILGFLAVLDIPVPPPDDSCLIVPVTSDPGTSCTVTTSMSSSGASVASHPLPVSFDIQRQMPSAETVSMDTLHSYHLEHSIHFLHQEGDDKADEEEIKPSVRTDIVRKDGVKQRKGQPQEATRSKGHPQEDTPKVAEDSDYEEFVNPMEWSSDSDVPEKADSDSSWKAEDEFEEKVLKKRVGRPRSVFTRKQRKSNPSEEPTESTTLKLRCEECSKDFPTLRGYNIHMKRVHSQESEAKGEAQDVLKSAGQLEENKEQTECETLDDFEDNQLLKGEDNVGDSNFEATFPCDSEIEEEETEDEIQEKIKDVLYACSICSRAYISDLGFHSHMKNKHQIPNADVKQHELPVGGTVAKCCKASKPGFWYYRCLTCKRVFGKPESMARHLRIGFYLQVTCETLCPEGRKLTIHGKSELFAQHKRFLCHKCGKEILGKKSFDNHVRKHVPPRKILSCEVCGFSTRLHTSFKVHLETHKLVRVRPCMCDICGKTYFDKSAVRDHKTRAHLRDKEFKCCVCGRVFYLKQDMVRHVKTHQGLRPHKCEECGQCFSTGYNLRVHQRIHTGEKPYKCKECEASFAQKNSLNVHMKKHPKRETDDLFESHDSEKNLESDV